MGTSGPKRVLITGASGFTGRHLREALVDQPGIEVLGISLNSGKGAEQTCDLSSFAETEKLLTTFCPSSIYHCAGAFTNRWQSDLRGNVMLSSNLLECMVKHSMSCRFLAIGSAAEYGRQRCPPTGIKEDAPLLPSTIYGLTKTLQTQLLSFYRRAHGVNVVTARTFNLYGDGCSPSLFPGRVLQQIEAIKAGGLGNIIVGKLDAWRDYIHVSEAVRAYLRIMHWGEPGEVYNVGSGVPMQVSEMLERLLAAHGLGWDVVKIDRTLGGNTADVEEMFADISKLNSLGSP